MKNKSNSQVKHPTKCCTNICAEFVNITVTGKNYVFYLFNLRNSPGRLAFTKNIHYIGLLS